MIAYKLVRIDKRGKLHSLFINKRIELPIGEWLPAGFYPTKGFAERLGWHCCKMPVAPHLTLDPKNGMRRVWVEVDLDGQITSYERPESQGGDWLLADQMKILRVLEAHEIPAY